MSRIIARRNYQLHLLPGHFNQNAHARSPRCADRAGPRRAARSGRTPRCARARPRRRGRTRSGRETRCGLLHVVRDDDDRDLGARSRRWSPRRAGWRSGRVPSTARPSAARRARPPASAAMHSRCCWPPDSAPPGCRRRLRTSFHSPARRRLDSTSASLSPHLDAGQLAGRSARCRRSTWSGTGWASGTPCRSGCAPRWALARVGRCPRRRAAPRRPVRRRGIISCIRLRIRRNVDLPQPDGPISAVTLPGVHVERDPLEHLVLAEPGRHPARLEPEQAETQAAESSDRRFRSSGFLYRVVRGVAPRASNCRFGRRADRAWYRFQTMAKSTGTATAQAGQRAHRGGRAGCP